ncbi:alpha/beta hydrolase [Leifsonia sp. NPDC014704]|uniref:alpha/beta hydrolase n=1 Tax=Leifsonia sp. NPDC014704 TaxID=3364123 RepID=UPI0036F46079
MTLHVVATLPLGIRRGTIIAIPGLSESAESLHATAVHWSDRGYRVLAIDPRGHGQSPRWSDEQLRRHPGDRIVEEIVEAVEEWCDESDQPLVIFGHSAGGSAAAAVAAATRQPAAGVILEDPFWRLPVTPHQDPLVAKVAAQWLARQKGLTDQRRQDEVAALHPRWPVDELAGWSSSKAEMDLALVAHGDVIPSRPWPVLLEDLSKRGTPVLIITGTVRVGNTTNHRAIERSLGAEVVVLDGASHFVRRDDRDRFHAQIDGFLARIGA